jgi:heptaprenyl diphosphate synthase
MGIFTKLNALRERLRISRRNCYEGLFSSRSLFIAGLVIMPALLFNPNTILRTAQFLLFWFFAWLCGKKNNPLITLLIIVFIIAFNLLVPYGQVLYAIGAFKITLNALVSGLHKAVTLEGLIMLSRAAIRRDLKLPGSLGALIGDSFRIFEEITERKGAIDRKNIAGSLDKLLFELSEDKAVPQSLPAEAQEAAPETTTEQKKKSALPGLLILAGVILLSWSPWLLFIPR